MIYWLIRTHFTKLYKKAGRPAPQAVPTFTAAAN